MNRYTPFLSRPVIWELKKELAFNCWVIMVVSGKVALRNLRIHLIIHYQRGQLLRLLFNFLLVLLALHKN